MSDFGPHLREYLEILASVYLLCIIFLPLELLLPAERGQPISKRLIGFIYIPLILALILLLIQPVFNSLYARGMALSGGGILPELIRPQSGPWAQLLFALLFALVWDLWQYWLHRLQHTIPFLWETHKFHHSETALNVTTQARHHSLHHILSLALYFPVLILFWSQVPHFVAAFLMFRLWGFVNHANVRLSFGPLTPVISGPQWHRIHHSINAEHFNKNFAAFFPFIDIIFGSYYRPQKREYPATGIRGEEGNSALREATVSPVFSMYRIATGWPGKPRRVLKKQRD